MTQLHEGDERARDRITEHVGTGKPVVIKVVGQAKNIVATIDEMVGVEVHGVKRLLVKATNARTKAGMRVYAASILAVKQVLTEG